MLPGAGVCYQVAKPCAVVEQAPWRASPDEPGVGGHRAVNQIGAVETPKDSRGACVLVQGPVGLVGVVHLLKPEPDRAGVALRLDRRIAAWGAKPAGQVVQQAGPVSECFTLPVKLVRFVLAGRM